VKTIEMNSQVKGKIEGVNTKFDKTDGVLVEGTWYNLKKGEGPKLIPHKGKDVTLDITETVGKDGKTYKNATVVSIAGGGAPATKAKFGSGTSFGGDRNQASIVFQSSLKVAQEFETRMSAETKGMNDSDARTHREKAYKQLLSTAFSLARVAINPTLDKPQVKKEEAASSEPSHDEVLEVEGGP
jgi:hypothetical protein